MDLNADCGESRTGDPGLPSDPDVLHSILDSVSSANIACGLHAGDPTMSRSTVRAAAARGVTIGAHVSYDDVRGFGRRFIDMDPTELSDLVVYQVGALQALARVEGTEVRYVKPHGALYNAIVHHTEQARAVAEAVASVGDLALFTLPDSEVGRIADRLGVRVLHEAFADRAYTPDGRLAPRGTPGSVLHDPEEVSARVVRMATSGQVTAVDGSVIDVRADSVCLHGDTSGALQIARSVRSALAEAGVHVGGVV